MIGAYPFRVGDEIRVSVRASVTTPVKLFARVRYVDGTDDLVEIDITHSAGDRTNELKRSSDLFKKAGWIEHLTVDTNLNNARGRFYMMVAINRKPHHFPIAAGYIDIPHVPLGVFEPAIHGSGFIRVISLGDPAAGSDYAAEVVPAGALWIVKGFKGTLVADGTGANRGPSVDYSDGTDLFGGSTTNQVHTASETTIYRGVSPGTSISESTGKGCNLALGEVPLPAGYEFQINTLNLQAGDDWGEGFIEVEEWIYP